MAAGIVDRIEIAIEVKDGNEFAVNIDAPAAARLRSRVLGGAVARLGGALSNENISKTR